MTAGLDIFLLMGQSNMAGRGVVGDEDREAHPDVLALDRDGCWQARGDPLHFDKSIAGVGPGLTFGKVLAGRRPGHRIGLVPCAVGGTPIARWRPGNDLYAEALRRAGIAAGAGRIRGVLWHQGESDGDREDTARAYADALTEVVTGLRRDLGDVRLPVVAGELGHFLRGNSFGHSPCADLVNTAIRSLPQRLPGFASVSSDGLGHNGDELHFDAAAARELGRRFAAAMLPLLTDAGG